MSREVTEAWRDLNSIQATRRCPLTASTISGQRCRTTSAVTGPLAAAGVGEGGGEGGWDVAGRPDSPDWAGSWD